MKLYKNFQILTCYTSYMPENFLEQATRLMASPLYCQTTPPSEQVIVLLLLAIISRLDKHEEPVED